MECTGQTNLMQTVDAEPRNPQHSKDLVLMSQCQTSQPPPASTWKHKRNLRNIGLNVQGFKAQCRQQSACNFVATEGNAHSDDITLLQSGVHKPMAHKHHIDTIKFLSFLSLFIQFL